MQEKTWEIKARREMLVRYRAPIVVFKNISQCEHAKWIVDSMTGGLFGTRKSGQGDTNPILGEIPPNDALRPKR